MGNKTAAHTFDQTTTTHIKISSSKNILYVFFFVQRVQWTNARAFCLLFFCVSCLFVHRSRYFIEASSSKNKKKSRALVAVVVIFMFVDTQAVSVDGTRSIVINEDWLVFGLEKKTNERTKLQFKRGFCLSSYKAEVHSLSLGHSQVYTCDHHRKHSMNTKSVWIQLKWR